ncbi:MAG: hypothetical protein SAqTSB_33550 [Shewanella algae]
MSQSGYHDGWEILSGNHSRPVPAWRLIEQIEKGSDLTNGIIRHQIAEDNDSYRCAHCRVPVRLAGGKGGTQCLHFRHFTKAPEYKQQAEGCPFCHPDSEQRKLYSEVFRGEGEWHLSHKEKVAEILSRDPRIDPDSVTTERYIFSKDHDTNIRRQPDIYCRDREGNHWVFELTRWWLHPETAVERQRAYRKLGYNLVWLFSPDCQEKNRSTFHLLLYGANYREDVPPEALGEGGAQFNAYELSEAALVQSDKEGSLHLEVVYPHFAVDEVLGSIDITYQREIMSMHALSLAPKERAPYGVKTAVQLQQAKELMEEARRAIALREEDRLRMQHSSAIKAIRRDLGTLRHLLRSKRMDDALAERCRALIKQCRSGYQPELSSSQGLRAGLVIVNAENKMRAAVDTYLREKAAREAQRQALTEMALGYIDQTRGRPLAPDSEPVNRGRELCKQLNQLALSELARRVESACHTCHRRYIDDYIGSLDKALTRYQPVSWVLENRLQVLSLLRYTKSFSERQLQNRLEKLLTVIDNHTVYLYYRRLINELVLPELRFGLVDDGLKVRESLIDAGLNEEADCLLTTLVRRYQNKARDYFAVFSKWDRKTNYRESLPLVIKASEDNPAAIAALMGCREASLSHLLPIRICYVGLAEKVSDDFFNAIGVALVSLVKTVTRPGYVHVADDYLAAEKIVNDCVLYASSFSSEGQQAKASALFDDCYGKELDQLCDYFSCGETG